MVIIPLQDYLGLGNEARINTPSTVGGNWEWRVKEEQLTDELKELIRTLTIKYRTVAEENAKKAAEEAQQQKKLIEEKGMKEFGKSFILFCIEIKKYAYKIIDIRLYGI